MKKITFLLTLIIISLNLLLGQIEPQMVLVEGGSFTMGCSEEPCQNDEKPPHKVTLPSFYIGKYEVTVKEYKEFLKDNYTEFDQFGIKKQLSPMPDSSWWQGHPDCYKFWKDQPTKWWGYNENYPIFNITWYEAIAYCNWLSQKKGLEKVYSIGPNNEIIIDLTKNGYRLPTEAEWEYTARGGKKSKNFLYAGSNEALDVAWVDENTLMIGPQEVGKLKPNELGIYDMSGNVWEWCNDYYSPYFYSNSPQFNPLNSTHTPYRVIRGGAWHFDKLDARVYTRDGPKPSFTDYTYGFRLARNAEAK